VTEKEIPAGYKTITKIVLAMLASSRETTVPAEPGFYSITVQPTGILLWSGQKFLVAKILPPQ
jgi:hypothetical protein